MIAIIGLGPVGTATADLLHERKYDIIGVDQREDRRTDKPYKTKHCARCAASHADHVVVCVHENDLTLLAADLHAVMRPGTLLTVRTTTIPGTVAELFGSEASYVPELRREARLQYAPPYGIIGSDVGQHALLEKLFFYSNTLTFRSSVEDTEKAKLALNAWHALKVAYANELSRVFGLEAMPLILRSMHQETQSDYLTPGAAYGGRCLPKDMKRLVAWAGDGAPILRAIVESNALHDV